MIWGYFDPRKRPLKLMLGPWTSGSKEILIELTNELLYFKHLAQTVAKLWTLKVGGQRKVETFWVRGYFFVRSYSESLLSERPGFESRLAQTLRHCNFAAPWPTKTKSTALE